MNANDIKVDPSIELNAARAVLREQAARVAELEAALREVAVPALMKVCIVRTDQLNPEHYYDEMDSVADKCHRALAAVRAALAKG